MTYRCALWTFLWDEYVICNTYDGQEVQQREHEEEMRACLRRSESIEKAAVSVFTDSHVYHVANEKTSELPLMIPLVATRRQRSSFPSAPWTQGSFSGNFPKAPPALYPHAQVGAIYCRSNLANQCNIKCSIADCLSLSFYIQANLHSVVTSAVWQTPPSSSRKPAAVLVPRLHSVPRSPPLSLAHRLAPSIAACPRPVQASVQ